MQSISSMFHKTIWVSLLFISFFSSAQQTKGLFLELGHSEEPIRTEIKDSLEMFLSNKKVIGLGEATHGTHEFFMIKKNFVRFLVEKLDFRIFAIESNFSAYSVNEYINGRQNNLGGAIFELHQVYHTQEVADLLTWMKAYNLNAPQERKIVFYGVDNYSIGSIPAQLLSYIQRVDPNAQKEYSERLRDFTGKLSYWKKLKYNRDISAIEKKFGMFRDEYIQRSSEREFQRYLKYVSVMREAVKNSAVLIRRSRKNSSFRDRGMANNVKWILNFEGNNSKMMLWAHNGHIQKTEYSLKGRDHYRMGMELQKTFKNDYYAIGFDFDKGSFNAVNYTAGGKMQPCIVSNDNSKSFSFQFNEVKKPCYFVDFLALENSRFKENLNSSEFIRHSGVGFSGENFSFIKLNVQKAFDALIFVEKTTPSVFVNAGRIR